jgi:putative redox protein
MYADRKKWPLEKVSVRFLQGKIHVEDCAECEAREGKVDRIEREILLTGPLDKEQRHWLLEIADKCPVHQTLEAAKRGPDPSHGLILLVVFRRG